MCHVTTCVCALVSCSDCASSSQLFSYIAKQGLIGAIATSTKTPSCSGTNQRGTAVLIRDSLENKPHILFVQTDTLIWMRRWNTFCFSFKKTCEYGLVDIRRGNGSTFCNRMSSSPGLLWHGPGWVARSFLDQLAQGT